MGISISATVAKREVSASQAGMEEAVAAAAAAGSANAATALQSRLERVQNTVG